MRVERQDGNLGHGDTEVALERLVHQHHLVEEQVVGERVGHLTQRHVVGDNADTDAVAHHHHQRTAAKLAGEIFRMTREIETRGLDILLVDGCRHQHIHEVVAQIFAGTVQRLARKGAGDFGRLAQVNLHLFVGEVDNIELAFDSLGSVTYRIEVHILMQGQQFLVVRGHIGGTIQQWCAELVHTSVAESFENHLIADTVDVAVANGDAGCIVSRHRIEG